MHPMARKDRKVCAGMLLPAVIFLFAVTALPMLYVLFTSFSNWRLTKSAYPVLTGFQSWGAMFKDPYFYNSLFVTLRFTIYSLAAEMVLGVVVALLLAREFPGRAIVRSFVLIPMMVTPTVIGLMWRIMLNSDFGIINWILEQMGFDPPAWLANSKTALLCLTVVDIWEWTPFVALSVLAALQTQSKDQMEGALIDGANTFQIFHYITIPHIQPVLFISASFRLGALLRSFDTFYVMTSGGPGISTQNLPRYIYKNAFYYMKMGYASALSVFLMIITILITYFFVYRSKIEA